MNLVKLDMLPGHCGLDTEVDRDTERLRFRASRVATDGNTVEHYSEWSGWFDMADCPIILTWAAFEWPSQR